MMVATKRAPLEWIKDADQHTRAAKTIAFQLFIIFIQDCKDLVTSHVQTSIKNGLKDPKQMTSDHAKRRQQTLKSWEKTVFALAWNTDNLPNGATYGQLMTILSDNPAVPLKQLDTSEQSWTYEVLARHIFTIGTATTPIVSAPILSNGAFLNALPVAIKYIRDQRTSGAEKLDEWIIRLFAVMMKNMHIHFVPWKKNTKGAKAVQATHWMMIKRASTERGNALGSGSGSGPQEDDSQVARNIADKNSSAPWCIPQHLHMMGSLWNKVVLPTDWDLKHACLGNLRQKSEAKYVCDTYDYTHQAYDGTNWVHHMALVWGILFSRVAPFVFFPKNSAIPRIENATAVTEGIRRLPWVAGTSKYHKGTTAPKPYVTMMTTAIIGFLDDNSPFSKHMNDNCYQQGAPWTNKHGK